MGHPLFGGRGLLDSTMHFNCKMQHLLKKICIKLSGSRKDRLFQKGGETGSQAQKGRQGSDLPSIVPQCESRTSRTTVVMAARVSYESRSSEQNVVMRQVLGQAGKLARQGCDRVWRE